MFCTKQNMYVVLLSVGKVISCWDKKGIPTYKGLNFHMGVHSHKNAINFKERTSNVCGGTSYIYGGVFNIYKIQTTKGFSKYVRKENERNMCIATVPILY